MCLFLDYLQQVRLPWVFTQMCALGFCTFDISCGGTDLANDMKVTLTKHICYVSREKTAWALESEAGSLCLLCHLPSSVNCLHLSKGSLIFFLFSQWLKHSLHHRLWGKSNGLCEHCVTQVLHKRWVTGCSLFASLRANVRFSTGRATFCRVVKKE